MRLQIGLALAALSLCTLAVNPPAEARTAKSKVQKMERAKAGPAPRRTAVGLRDGGWEPFPGTPGLRDRSTIYHPNGRLNGQELFDSIADRAGGIGN